MNKTLNIANKLRPFLYGELYPVILALVAIMAQTLNLCVFGFFIYGFLAVVTLLLYDDVTPFMPIPMMAFLMVNDLNVFLSFPIYIPLGATFICVAFRFFLYPVKIKKQMLYLPLIILSVALFLSGAFAPNLFSYYYKGLVSRSATGLIVLFIYFFFITQLKPPKGFDLKKYICYNLTLLGFICFSELVVYSFNFDFILCKPLSSSLGWNNVNGVAALVVVAIPACFYMLIKTGKTLLYSLVIVSLYIAIFLSKSDGCLGIAIASFPLLLLLSIIKSDKKQRVLIVYEFLSLALVAVTALTLIYGNLLLPTFEKFNNSIVDGGGRSNLFIDAINTFLKYPIFGIGIGYCPEGGEISTNIILAYNYHSTFFHVIATMGVAGLVAYIYYFVNRYRIIMAKNTTFNILIYLSFSLMEVYGFVDTCEFNIAPLMMVVTIMLSATEIANSIDTAHLPLNKIKG